tara:strand:- start:42235 stop:42846 length:612 start_codon:yes stop_codon:yes gene_type:complete
MQKKIGIINYGSGNYLSVLNAINFLGYQVEEITNNEDFDKVNNIIIPGVGSYKACMDNLKKKNILDGLYKNIDKNKFFLGICVGMQILSTYGFEFNKSQGLDIIKGKTIKIENKRLKVPHMGWSEITINKKSDIFKDIKDYSSFYFLHSYHFDCQNKENVSSYVKYENMFVASIEKKNIYGVQFHPEKSQRNGLILLNNFCKL